MNNVRANDFILVFSVDTYFLSEIQINVLIQAGKIVLRHSHVPCLSFN